MKIDINREPPADIFKDRGRYTWIFIVLLASACFGLLLGVYAVVADTRYYEQLETAALTFFVGAAIFLFYFGEKLQAYKKLSPNQKKELAGLCDKYFEIRGYCDLVAKADRQVIFAEYEACQAWAEEKEHQSGQEKKY